MSFQIVLSVCTQIITTAQIEIRQTKYFGFEQNTNCMHIPHKSQSIACGGIVIRINDSNQLSFKMIRISLLLK